MEGDSEGSLLQKTAPKARSRVSQMLCVNAVCIGHAHNELLTGRVQQLALGDTQTVYEMQ